MNGPPDAWHNDPSLEIKVLEWPEVLVSYEAFGDGDDGQDYDHLIEAGWWTSEQAAEVVAAINALRAEPMYQDGDMTKGVSTRFIMRVTLLTAAAGIEIPEQFVAEARAAMETSGDKA